MKRVQTTIAQGETLNVNAPVSGYYSVRFWHALAYFGLVLGVGWWLFFAVFMRPELPFLLIGLATSEWLRRQYRGQASTTSSGVLTHIVIAYTAPVLLAFIVLSGFLFLYPTPIIDRYEAGYLWLAHIPGIILLVCYLLVALIAKWKTTQTWHPLLTWGIAAMASVLIGMLVLMLFVVWGGLLAAL